MFDIHIVTIVGMINEMWDVVANENGRSEIKFIINIAVKRGNIKLFLIFLLVRLKISFEKIVFILFIML